MTDSASGRRRTGTILAHDGPQPLGAVVPPIFQSSLFAFESVEAFEAGMASLGETQPLYSRGHNPTVQAFERKVAELEGAGAARAFSSGMAAISAALFSQMRAGDRVVCVQHVYPDAFKLLTQLGPQQGWTVDFVDGRDLDAVARALPGARVLYLESPTSQTFQLQDLPALAALARQHGVYSIIDNSWATPLFQRPLADGIDLVVHSASKYLGGHSDTVAGVLVGSVEDVRRINGLAYAVLGAKLSPFEGFLLLRGLRTLHLRLPAHMHAALEIARRLEPHPEVRRVHHPGLDSHPQRSLAARSLSGTTGLFSFELDRDDAGLRRFVNALRYFRIGVSWGGHESLVFPALVAHQHPGDLNPYTRFGISRQLIRLHVGLEDVEDLWSDLQRALNE